MTHLTLPQVGSDIKAEHHALGIAKKQLMWKVHKSTATLLAVPQYSDLLDDQDGKDESEHGRIFINTRQGWHTEMVKWIGDVRSAELTKDSHDEDGMEDLVAVDCASTWKPTTLAVLFSSQKECPSWLLPEEIDTESALIQALADLEEDKWLDGGAMEIDSDKEYCTWTMVGLILCGIFW